MIFPDLRRRAPWATYPHQFHVGGLECGPPAPSKQEQVDLGVCAVLALGRGLRDNGGLDHSGGSGDREKWRDQDSLMDSMREREKAKETSQVMACVHHAAGLDPGDCEGSSLSCLSGEGWDAFNQPCSSTTAGCTSARRYWRGGAPWARAELWVPQCRGRPGGLLKGAELSGLRWGVC